MAQVVSANLRITELEGQLEKKAREHRELERLRERNRVLEERLRRAAWRDPPTRSERIRSMATARSDDDLNQVLLGEVARRLQGPDAGRARAGILTLFGPLRPGPG